MLSRERERERSCVGSGVRHWLKRWVDYGETYGPHVVERFLIQCRSAETVLDIGAGGGRDLGVARRIFPGAETLALECYPPNIELLTAAGCRTYQFDLERESFPFAAESIDIIIANQILEHTKELFWIVHEMTRTLRVGGHLLIGVPNVASLHNRIGLLFGRHPTQAKACSAHVRCFSRNDFLLFLQEGFPGGYELRDFAGSQFYPFPRAVARRLSACFPAAAFSIFFLLRKTRPYGDSFLQYPRAAHLETNFKLE